MVISFLLMMAIIKVNRIELKNFLIRSLFNEKFTLEKILFQDDKKERKRLATIDYLPSF